MTDSTSSGNGLPVVIDEWTVQVWADSKISPATAARLIAEVDTGLTRALQRINQAIAARPQFGTIRPRVATADRRR